MGVPVLETMSGWEGDVEELAQVGGQWCTMLRIEHRPELTVRLVRDYAQRGILDRPRREGKIALYAWKHLVCLLAARLLLRDGWPLEKIADEFTIMSLAEIRALLPGSGSSEAALQRSSVEQHRTDPALDALRAIRSRAAERLGAPSTGTNRLAAFQKTVPITERATLKQELAGSREKLGEAVGEVSSRAYSRIEIASGVELHIEAARLRSLGRAEANAIARAVHASLLNPLIRKEEKPE